MTNIQKMFSEEIRRLAKKEVKAATEPLKTQITSLRKQVAQQKLQLQSMGQTQKPDASAPVEVQENGEKAKKFRMPGARIKKIRIHCGLTQAQMAKLLGASHSAVVKWENNGASPRGDMKGKIAELGKLGKRELQKRLEALEEMK